MAGHIGAEISGVDLSKPLSDEVVKAIRAAWLQWKVVFFRDADITPAQQVAFGRYFGDVTPAHTSLAALDEAHPEVLPLDGVAKERTDRSIGMNTAVFTTNAEPGWHSDVSFVLNPPMASALRALVVPDRGGDTQWSSSVAAYEALSAPMKQLVDGLHAVHHNVGFHRAHGASEIRTLHPVVRVHPETGERALLVNPIFTSHIAELTLAESRDVLSMLYRHQANPEFTVRFRWEPNSMAFWDNRSACHLAPLDVPAGVRRTMHRITLAGDVPVGIDGSPSQSLVGESFR